MDERDLIAAIEAAPADDAPRLVYADWLLDRGDPRGELIQIQLSPQRESARDRERELIDAHGAKWSKIPAHHPLVRWTFERGFPTRRFGHAGLFVREVAPQRLLQCLRFYPDGQVISVSVGTQRDMPMDVPRTLAQVANWFTPSHQGSSIGEYSVFRVASIRFTERTRSMPEPVVVDYEGTIEVGALDLSSHSHFNGLRERATWTLRDVEGCDTRL